MRTFADIPALLLAVAAAQEGLLSAEQCDRHGVGSARRSRLVRAGRWMAVTRGVVDTIVVPLRERTVADVPVGALPPLSRSDDAEASRSVRALRTAHRALSSADVVLEHRRRRKAWVGMLAFGPAATAVGTNALALHGVEGLPVDLRSEAALPHASDRVDRPGALLRQFDDGMTTVPFGDRRTGERQIASVDWAIAQAVPELPMAHGLAVLDSALRLEVLDRAGLALAHDHARGRRGVALRHELWDLADPRAESALESFGRWGCIEEGVPPDDLQLPVHAPSGRLLGVADMVWHLPGSRLLVAEMDGRAWHEGDERADHRDRDRDNDFAADPRIDLLRFDARHVRARTVGTQVRAFLGAARSRVNTGSGSNTGLGSY
ncbi:hypothetical protein GCM10009809_03270 [Isoptericola hypogeus]|uniref:Transcriptional regulator, AbiEi antitoxin, Type IV TA system n=1 Tax=Isoptericola hypogeus TaxID=300179 RepID=A0ABN2IRV4_9MICO